MREDGDDGPEAGLAPVIPLFGAPNGERAKRDETGSAETADPGPGLDPVWTATWRDDADDADDPLESGFDDDPARAGIARVFHDSSGEADAATRADLAEKLLLRKLHGRSLSVSEARALIAGSGLGSEERDAIIDAFLERRYLDDAALAEQLVHVALDRRGSGRRVIAQTLAKRGIPRDVADTALDALPDDDAERALEFAKSKARSLASLDHDTALRRLSGQLARRGYPGSLALSAARQALAEESTASGVRFR